MTWLSDNLSSPFDRHLFLGLCCVPMNTTEQFGLKVTHPLSEYLTSPWWFTYPRT